MKEIREGRKPYDPAPRGVGIHTNKRGTQAYWLFIYHASENQSIL